MSEPERLTLAVVDNGLHVNGVLNFKTAATMAPALHTCIAGLPSAFTIELAGLRDFNSAVLVFMLDCVRLSANANKQCRFSGATAALANLLKMAALSDLIQAT